MILQSTPIFLGSMLMLALAQSSIVPADAVPAPWFGQPDMHIDLRQSTSDPITLDDSNFEFLLDDLSKLPALFKDEIMPEVRKMLLEHRDELVGEYIHYISVQYDMDGMMRIEVITQPDTFPDQMIEVNPKVSPAITTLRYIQITMPITANVTAPEWYPSMVNRLEEFNLVRIEVLANHAIETLTAHRDRLQNFSPSGEPTSPDADDTKAAISLIVLKMLDLDLARTTIFYPINEDGDQPVAVDEIKATGLSTVPEFSAVGMLAAIAVSTAILSRLWMNHRTYQ
ncbi:MAG: hypothetical protein MN733_32625 [Nitrososphaera sp.]|nr:hypothetical protein [Nitrososphaera sp.]